MKEKLRLWHYDKDKPDLTVEVEYVRLVELYGRPLDPDEKVYDVVVDGDRAGQIHQVLANTTSPLGRGSRLVRHNKGTLEWAWLRPRTMNDNKGTGPIHNAPGLCARTRRDAVAEILGYSSAEKV